MKYGENNYRMSQSEISLLCYKLFMLADAGVNIDDAVSDISESSENKKAVFRDKKYLRVSGLHV